MAAAARDPAELDFVLTPDTSGIEVRRRAEYDLYTRPADARIPLVVFVHGPVRGAQSIPSTLRSGPSPAVAGSSGTGSKIGRSGKGDRAHVPRRADADARPHPG